MIATQSTHLRPLEQLQDMLLVGVEAIPAVDALTATMTPSTPTPHPAVTASARSQASRVYWVVWDLAVSLVDFSAVAKTSRALVRDHAELALALEAGEAILPTSQAVRVEAARRRLSVNGLKPPRPPWSPEPSKHSDLATKLVHGLATRASVSRLLPSVLEVSMVFSAATRTRRVNAIWLKLSSVVLQLLVLSTDPAPSHALVETSVATLPRTAASAHAAEA